MSLFRDRLDAGRKLAAALGKYDEEPDVVVLGLPRGGVPVAHEVARAIGAPLDIFLVRKLGVPGHEELAMGAIASGGVRVLNEDIIQAARVTDKTIAAVAAQEQVELERRERLYRGNRPEVDFAGRVVVVVDDGLATGASMRAAVAALRTKQPKKIVVAVPLAAPDTCALMEGVADEVVCLETPEPFRAVGAWYDDFSQTTDDEVKECLRQAAVTH